MKKLPAVEDAKALLSEGMEWSIWRWLLEKSRVRRVADEGTAALDELEKQVKAAWSDDMKKAYAEAEAEIELDGKSKSKKHYEKVKAEAAAVPAVLKEAAKRVKEADDIASEARWNSEDRFEIAERRLSGSLARDAAAKAIEAYDLREKAIRKAESAERHVKTGVTNVN